MFANRHRPSHGVQCWCRIGQQFHVKYTLGICQKIQRGPTYGRILKHARLRVTLGSSFTADVSPTGRITSGLVGVGSSSNVTCGKLHQLCTIFSVISLVETWYNKKLHCLLHCCDLRLKRSECLPVVWSQKTTLGSLKWRKSGRQEKARGLKKLQHFHWSSKPSGPACWMWPNGVLQDVDSQPGACGIAGDVWWPWGPKICGFILQITSPPPSSTWIVSMWGAVKDTWSSVDPTGWPKSFKGSAVVSRWPAPLLCAWIRSGIF